MKKLFTRFAFKSFLIVCIGVGFSVGEAKGQYAIYGTITHTDPAKPFCNGTITITVTTTCYDPYTVWWIRDNGWSTPDGSGDGNHVLTFSLPQGRHIFHISDACGDAMDVDDSIGFGPPCSLTASASYTPISAPGCTDATITFTGTTNICSGNWVVSDNNFAHYLPTDSSYTFTNLSSGEHYFLIQDESACNSILDTVFIPEIPCTITSSTFYTPLSIAGCTDGSITVSATTNSCDGLWNVDGGVLSASGSSITFTGMSAGKHYFTFNSTAGCSKLDSVVIPEGPLPIISVGGNTTFCQGNSVTLTASPGTAYSWYPNGESTQSITVSSGGSYSVLVWTNNNNCFTMSDPTVVTVLPVPSASINPMGASICLGANAALTASGGTSYAWSNFAGSTAQVIVSPNVQTTYTVTVTDANNCTATASSTISVVPVAALITPSAVSICNGASTTLTATGSNTYAWSNGLGTSAQVSVSPTGTTTYTVTASNLNCTATASATVTVKAKPTVSPTASPSAICNGSSTTLAANATAGSGTISTYAWSSGLAGNVSGGTVSPTGNTTYRVTVTNSNGCSATGSVAVTVNAKPTAAPGATPATICHGSSTTLAANATAGSGTISTYAWSSGLAGNVSGGIVSPLATTTYTVTITNSNGCSVSASKIVTVKTIAVTGTVVNASNGLTNGTITLVVNGGTPAYTFHWNTNAVTQNLTGLGNGTYSVTVTDAGGCTASSSFAVIGSVIISGKIKSPLNAGVRTTTVKSDGVAHLSVITDTSGRFSFALPQGSADTITPAKNNDLTVTNGVTSLDVLMVKKYILGQYTFNSPYKLIAADVNSSGTITQTDVALMKSLILGTSKLFPFNKLWSFVPSSYVFPNPQNPFPFPSSRYYTSVTNLTGQDFIGMKLGDVNYSWNPLIAKTEASPDTTTFYTPQLTDAYKDSDVWLPVKAKNFKYLASFQFTMHWDSTKLSFADVDTSGMCLEVEYGDSRKTEGLLSILWIDPNTYTTVADDSTVFRVKFHVTGNEGDLVNIFLDTTVIPVEVIDSALNEVDYLTLTGTLAIHDLGLGIAAPTLLEGNLTIYPNPARESVTVSIDETMLGSTLTITDITGKKMAAVQLKTVNSRLETSGFAQGIYFVTIESGRGRVTRKLVIEHSN